MDVNYFLFSGLREHVVYLLNYLISRFLQVRGNVLQAGLHLFVP